MNPEQMQKSERGTRNRLDKLRALNLPERVQVECGTNGEPRTVKRASGQTTSVESIQESWRIDDEWWRQPIARHYHDVVLTGGKRVVLFEDLVTREWWMQKP